VDAARTVGKKGLGEMLLEEELLTPEQLETAMDFQRRQGGKLSDIVVSQGLLKAEEMAAVLSIQLNLPLIDLKRHTIQPDVVRLIPEDMARKHKLIPLDVVDDWLVVVMADPEDIRTIEDIKTQTKMKVEVALGVASEIDQAIDLNYRATAEIEKQVSQFASPVAKPPPASSELSARAPAIQTLDLLIGQAVRDRASDIHIEPQEDRLRIRYRIDGVLHDMPSLPPEAHMSLVSRIKILAEMNVAEQRRPQDGRFSMQIGDKAVDIRVATMNTAYGERATLRILDKSLPLLTLPQLGMSAEALKSYQVMLNSPFGMILVSGPTGSGKTTTLYASINQFDRKERNIVTVEDPIEYHFKDISQTQVNAKAGITFPVGLRAIMRHDPNVILIGEIRDKDTASTAMQAALTGHLVLSSVHANDAIGVPFRLMDLGVEPYLIASTLTGIVAQRMVRRICAHCRVPSQPSPAEVMAYENEMKESPGVLHRGAGCKMCAGTGYLGRTGLFEVMVVTEEIRRMLLNSASTDAIRARALEEGLVTMKRDGMLKVKEGITSAAEVVRSVLSVT